MIGTRDLIQANINEVNDWWQKAQPGDSFVYHVGSLCDDKHSHNWSTLTKDEQKRLASINMAASFLLKAAERGQCHLVQRKLGDRHYEYIAVRRAA